MKVIGVWCCLDTNTFITPTLWETFHFWVNYPFKYINIVVEIRGKKSIFVDASWFLLKRFLIDPQKLKINTHECLQWSLKPRTKMLFKENNKPSFYIINSVYKENSEGNFTISHLKVSTEWKITLSFSKSMLFEVIRNDSSMHMFLFWPYTDQNVLTWSSNEKQKIFQYFFLFSGDVSCLFI